MKTFKDKRVKLELSLMQVFYLMKIHNHLNRGGGLKNQFLSKDFHVYIPLFAVVRDNVNKEEFDFLNRKWKKIWKEYLARKKEDKRLLENKQDKYPKIRSWHSDEN